MPYKRSGSAFRCPHLPKSIKPLLVAKAHEIEGVWQVGFLQKVQQEGKIIEKVAVGTNRKGLIENS
jgi:hypothetical protein